MKEVTKKVTLTADEARQFALEKNYIHYSPFEPTPVMDKMRAAGVDPRDYNLFVKIDRRLDRYTYSMKVKKYTLAERLKMLIAELLRN